MTTHRIVFLFDVDNTLLENDRVTADLKRHLQREVGAKRAEHYWAIFEQLRSELEKSTRHVALLVQRGANNRIFFSLSLKD